jgi:hypothetical protein
MVSRWVQEIMGHAGKLATNSTPRMRHGANELSVDILLDEYGSSYSPLLPAFFRRRRRLLKHMEKMRSFEY